MFNKFKEYYNRCLYCSCSKKKCLKKIKYIKNRFDISININNLRQRKLYYYQVSFGDDEYLALSFNATKEEYCNIKQQINALSPDEYLNLEDKEMVDDFLHLLNAYLERQECKEEELSDIYKKSRCFINKVVRFKDYGINGDENRLSFVKGSDVNGYTLLWMACDRVCYAEFYS